MLFVLNGTVDQKHSDYFISLKIFTMQYVYAEKLLTCLISDQTIWELLFYFFIYLFLFIYLFFVIEIPAISSVFVLLWLYLAYWFI